MKRNYNVILYYTFIFDLKYYFLYQFFTHQLISMNVSDILVWNVNVLAGQNPIIVNEKNIYRNWIGKELNKYEMKER